MKSKMKVVSPFEYAITQIVDPEAAKNMREETLTEKRERIEKDFKDKASRIKIKKTNKLKR